MGLRIIISVLLVHMASCDRLKDSIYTDFGQDLRACFRRLNGTDEFGCTSDLKGNVGVLMYIETEDISAVQNEEFAPYIALINPEVFSGRLMQKLKETGNVRGIVLPGIEDGKWKDKRPPSYSEDSGCPNKDGSVYPSTEDQCGDVNNPWNKAGENVLWKNWDFPIFLLKNSNLSEKLYDCWDQHNSGSDATWPLCAVELNSPMYAAKDSETCWRRTNIINTLTPQRYCDPLSDSNIVYTTSPRNRTTPNNSTKIQSEKSVILVVTRLDALNIFDKEEVGFDSPTTGIVTLLAAAKELKQLLGESPRYKSGVENVMFLLVHGESFDYIGSSRVVYDMLSDSFPTNITDRLQDDKVYMNGTQQTMNLDNIKLIIELGQLSNRKSNELFLHTANADAEVNAAIDSLKSSSLNFRLSSRNILPPASSQAFLKERNDIPVLMITNYDQQYTNDYFHSIYDTARANNYNYTEGEGQPVVGHLANLGAALASTIYKLSTEASLQAKPDATLVNELLHCYSQTANCSMFKEASSPTSFPWNGPEQTAPLAQYISVHTSVHTVMTKNILQYLTGEYEPQIDVLPADEEPSMSDQQTACLEKNDKQDVFHYVYLVGAGCYNRTGVQCGKCYKTTVDLTLARSPAFDEDVIDDYDWTSGKYPTWTESIWKSLSGRMFLKPSPASQHTTLSIGILVILLSFPLTYWIERKSATIFNTGPSMHENVNPVSL